MALGSMVSAQPGVSMFLWDKVPKVAFGRCRVHNDSEYDAYILYMLAHTVSFPCIVTLCLRQVLGTEALSEPLLAFGNSAL